MPVPSWIADALNGAVQLVAVLHCADETRAVPGPADEERYVEQIGLFLRSARQELYARAAVTCRHRHPLRPIYR